MHKGVLVGHECMYDHNVFATHSLTCTISTLKYTGFITVVKYTPLCFCVIIILMSECILADCNLKTITFWGNQLMSQLTVLRVSYM